MPREGLLQVVGAGWANQTLDRATRHGDQGRKASPGSPALDLGRVRHGPGNQPNNRNKEAEEAGKGRGKNPGHTR